MKATIDPRALRDAVMIAQRIIPRPTLPVLSHVLMTVRNGWVSVESTDLNTRTYRTVPAVTVEPGAVALPARDLLHVLAAIPGAVSFEASLTAKQSPSVSITSDGVALTMPVIRLDEFPSTPDAGEADGSLIINARAFRQVVEHAIRSAAPDDTRPVLAGIQLSAGDGGLTVASADGFRLTVQSVAAWPGGLDALVPWRALAVMVRSTRPDNVLSVETFKHAKNGRTFKLSTADGCWWTSRMIEGAYPDYRRIVPKAGAVTTRVTVAADDMRRAATVAATLGYEGILRLEVVADALVASIRNTEGTSGTFTLPAAVKGQTINLAISGQFLRDALVGMSDRVTIELVSASSAVTIRQADGNGPRQYIMPMNVGR